MDNKVFRNLLDTLELSQHPGLYNIDCLGKEMLLRFALLGSFAPEPATFGLEAMADAWMVDDPVPSVDVLVELKLLETVGDRYQIDPLVAACAKSLLTEAGSAETDGEQIEEFEEMQIGWDPVGGYTESLLTDVSLINLNEIPLTKQAIAIVGEQIGNTILDAGQVTPLSAYVKLRGLRDAIDAAMRQISPDALDEAEANPGNTMHSVKYQVRDGRITYGYNHDQIWTGLKAGEKAMADQRKGREAFLRNMDREMVDPASGEFIESAKVKKVGDSVLALTFPKK